MEFHAIPTQSGNASEIAFNASQFSHPHLIFQLVTKCLLPQCEDTKIIIFKLN